MNRKADKRSGNAVPTKVAGYDPSFGDRLSTVVERLGSLVEAGKIAGVTDEAIAKWRDGITKPNLFGIVKLAEAAHVDVSWLATGQGPSTESMGQMQIMGPLSGLPADIIDDVAFVRKLDVQASAGTGAVAVYEDEPEEALQFIAFQASWLRARHINPDACRVLSARGDSMEPTIRDGDTLLIDTSIDRAKDNTLYVIVFDGLVFVKRIHKKMTGGILLISDNPLYPDEEVPPNEVPNIHIAGRVVWYGRHI